MKTIVLASALAIAVGATSGAQAAPVLSSSAYAALVQLSVGGIVKADALFASAAGTAPPTYLDAGALATIDQNAVLVAGTLTSPLAARDTLTTRAVSASASATGSSATGTTTIDDAALSIGTTVLTSLGLTANTITSTTTAGFGSSGVYATGGSTIEGLGVGGSVLGLLTIDGSLFASADPNTVLLNQLGVVITLNEQGKVQDATSVSMFTNAIHVSLTDFLLNGRLVSGDIILGHSQAAVSGFVLAAPVPESATWAMMVVGFGLVGVAMRGARRRLLIHA